MEQVKKVYSDITVTIIRSGRKSIGLEVKPDGQVIVRVPQKLPEREISRFVIQHADWIQKH